jgi:hypothetical protein
MVRISIYSPFFKLNIVSPFNLPYVRLSLRTYSESEGHILLSPQLVNDHEIDYTVDQLKDELEEFRRKAKKELQKLRENM